MLSPVKPPYCDARDVKTKYRFSNPKLKAEGAVALPAIHAWMQKTALEGTMA